MVFDFRKDGVPHWKVDSLEKMRLVTHSPGTIIVTDGRFGSNYFKKIASGVENGGTIFVLDNGDVYELQYEGAINVKWFGTNIARKTMSLFERAYKMDTYNTPIENAFIDYGATRDDGWSNSEHLITGTKYYFSFSSGNDANDGLTPSTPKKYLSTALEILNTSPAGTGVLFKRGDVWDTSAWQNYVGYAKDAIGSVDAQMVMSCWGLGELPKFTSLSNTILTWTDNGDGTWYSTDLGGITSKIPGMEINGIWEIASDSLSGLLTEVGSTWYHDTSNSKLYVNTDPAAFTSIKVAKHNSWFRFGANTKYLDISYLNIGHNRDSNLEFINKSITDVSIHNCELGEKSIRSVVYTGSNLTFYQNTVNAKEPDSSKYVAAPHTCYGFEGLYVVVAANDTGKISIRNNTFKDFKHANVLISSEDKLADNSMVEVDVERNIFTQAEWIDYGGSYSLEGMLSKTKFNNNILYKVKTVQLAGVSETKGNIFYKTRDSDLLSKQGNIGNATKTILSTGQSASPKIKGNVFFKCDSVAYNIISNNWGVIDGSVFEENICYDNGKRLLNSGISLGVGIQLSIVALDTRYTYQPSNTKIMNNVLFSPSSIYTIYYGRGDDQTDSNNYLTVEAAQSKVYQDGTVFSGNTSVDIASFVET